MSLNTAEYYKATRHPWACVVFVLPLLVLYEVGVHFLGGAATTSLRNGADTWMQGLMSRAGLLQPFWPALFLTLILLAWTWFAWRDRPKEIASVWAGMAIESLIFAIGLWLVSLALGPFIDTFGFPLKTASQPEPALLELVAYLGAGIYEEALFRLLLFTLLYWLFLAGDLPGIAALLLSALVSSLMFAAAHHVGPAGEPFSGYAFLFRTIAGVYFAAIYRWRGFGIAAGAHAVYDVLVGLLINQSP